PDLPGAEAAERARPGRGVRPAAGRPQADRLPAERGRPRGADRLAAPAAGDAGAAPRGDAEGLLRRLPPARRAGLDAAGDAGPAPGAGDPARADPGDGRGRGPPSPGP